MKINVDALHEVAPKYEMRRPFSLDLTVSISEYKQQTLFNQIWEFVGDEVISDWLKSEGYTLTKNAEKIELT